MPELMLSQQAILDGYQVEQYESVGSTNVLALEKAQVSLNGRLWIVAREQTAGRGRRGNVWDSKKGNLFSSLVLVDEFSSNTAALLGFVAGVSLAETIEEIAISRGIMFLSVKLKWPNDILLNSAKASGILLEMSRLKDGRQALVIGMGLNIAHYPENLPYPATSLSASGLLVPMEEVFTKLSERWAVNFALWQSGNGRINIHQRWLGYAANLGGPIHVTQNGAVHSGNFETLDDDFCCILRKNDGTRLVINAGDVHFGTVASAHNKQ